MADIRSLRAGDEAGAIRRRGRRLDTYSMELGGGLFANVALGRVSGFGIEPVGPVVPLPAEHRRRHLVLAWAAPLGAAATGAAVAAGFAFRHRRAA